MEFKNRNPKIYVISGKAKSGKDACAKIICNYYKNKKCIKLSFGYYLKNYAKTIIGWNGKERTKPRDFLQQIGIELIKNKIDDKLLINRVCDDIKVYSYFYDIIIITDARLVDEIKSIKDNFSNAVFIKIEKGNDNNGLTKLQQNHITEIDMDNYNDYDYIINNNKSIKELKSKIVSILED